MIKSFEVNGIRKAKKYAKDHNIKPDLNGFYHCQAQWKEDYREYITDNIIGAVDWCIECLQQKYIVKINNITVKED